MATLTKPGFFNLTPLFDSSEREKEVQPAAGQKNDVTLFRQGFSATIAGAYAPHTASSVTETTLTTYSETDPEKQKRFAYLFKTQVGISQSPEDLFGGMAKATKDFAKTYGKTLFKAGARLGVDTGQATTELVFKEILTSKQAPKPAEDNSAPDPNVAAKKRSEHFQKVAEELQVVSIEEIRNDAFRALGALPTQEELESHGISPNGKGERKLAKGIIFAIATKRKWDDDKQKQDQVSANLIQGLESKSPPGKDNNLRIDHKEGDSIVGNNSNGGQG